MFLEGVPVRVSALSPSVAFPVPQDTPSTADLATWDHSDTWDYYKRSFAEVRSTPRPSPHKHAMLNTKDWD